MRQWRSTIQTSPRRYWIHLLPDGWGGPEGGLVDLLWHTNAWSFSGTWNIRRAWFFSDTWCKMANLMALGVKLGIHQILLMASFMPGSTATWASCSWFTMVWHPCLLLINSWSVIRSHWMILPVAVGNIKIPLLDSLTHVTIHMAFMMHVLWFLHFHFC